MNKNRNNRNRNRNRKPDSRRPKNRDVENKEYVDERGESHPLNNDPSWYFHDKFLAKQVSDFSFNQILGAADAFVGTDFNYRTPVACVLSFNPSIGWSADSQSGRVGINQASITMYTTLSASNAKTTNYAPQDISTLMLALGEVLSLSEHLRRAFGLAFTYSKRNWAYARDIIQMSGVDADDLFKKMANYRIQFNTIINSINKITFPADVNYFKKCAYMYAHIFLDSESPMAQTYIYRPYSVWEVDENSYEEGTILKTKYVPNTATMAELLDLLSSMVDAILNSATFNYIYADVLRLYGDANTFTIPFCTEEYIVVPEYDPLALLQINNATLIGEPVGTERDADVTPSNDVYPQVATNKLIYCPQFNTKRVLQDDVIINFPHSMGDPDETQRIESTRFTVIAKGGEDFTSVAALPDHYIVSARFFTNGSEFLMGLNASAYDRTVSYYASEMAKNVPIVDKFSGAPRLYSVENDGSGNKVYDFFGDLDFYTTIDMNYLTGVNNLV
jgi:hypothetical protein